MTHTAVTYDDRHYTFPDHSLQAVEQAVLKRLPVRLEGELVQGADIRRIEKGAETESNAGTRIALPELTGFLTGNPDYKQFFWRNVMVENMARQKAGKHWLREQEVLAARQASGADNAPDIFAWYAEQEGKELA